MKSMQAYRQIARLHLENGARVAAESHTAAISKIESIVAVENIDCDFKRVGGYLFLGPRTQKKLWTRNWQAAQRAGVSVAKEQSFNFGLTVGPCLKFPEQAQFHPGKYMAGLANAFKRAGGKIFGKTEAKEIKGGESVRNKNRQGPQDHRRCSGGGHEHTGQRLGEDTHQTSRLSYLRDWRAGACSIPFRQLFIGIPKTRFTTYVCSASAKEQRHATY